MARAGRPRTLRQKIADWPPLTAATGRLVAGWLRLVRATSSWHSDGWDEVAASVRDHGSVIIVFWHQRVFGSVFCFDTAKAAGRSLNSDSRAGRLGRVVLERFGFKTIPIRKGRTGLTTLREVLAGLSGGTSIGIAVDGPSGPYRVVKPTPVQWARASGKPVYIFAFSARAYWSLPTWDRLMMPKPFTRVALVWRRWEREVPKKLSEAAAEALVADLKDALDAATEQADRTAGHSGLLM